MEILVCQKKFFMEKSNFVKKGKFLSFVTRHRDFVDDNGWVKFCDIENLTEDEIIFLAENDDKKRFEIEVSEKKIRAYNGHTKPVTISSYEKVEVPIELFHGTKQKFMRSILEKGILSGRRNFVHLSDNMTDAEKVAVRRRGQNVILKIDTAQMIKDGVKISKTPNGVFLVPFVDKKYILDIETLKKEFTNRVQSNSEKNFSFFESEIVNVIDFEFSCWRGYPPKGSKHEIIEVGIVEYNTKTKELLNKKSFLISNEFGTVSDFCSKITGITQEDINNNGFEFKEVIEILKNEYDLENRKAFFWGSSDYKQLEDDCRRKKVKIPINKFYDLQKIFKSKVGNKNDMSLKNAVSYIGEEFEGKTHSAGDDAYNTAKILSYFF